MEGVNFNTIPNVIVRYYLSLINKGIDTGTDDKLQITDFEIPFLVGANLCVFRSSDHYDSKGNLIGEKGDLFFEVRVCQCLSENERTQIEKIIDSNASDYSVNVDWDVTDGLFTSYENGIREGQKNVRMEFDGIYSVNTNANPIGVRHRLFSNVYENKASSMAFINCYENDPNFNPDKWELFEMGVAVGKLKESWRLILNNPLDFLEFFEKELLPNSEDSINQTESFEDLDNTVSTDVKNKLRYFYELGVFEHLMNAFENELNPNQIAFIVSKMTGCEQNTAYQVIRAVRNNLQENFNHPEYAEERMKRVRKNLEKFGEKRLK